MPVESATPIRTSTAVKGQTMKRRFMSLELLAIISLTCIAQIAAGGDYYDAVIADDPVAYWRLGEADGNFAANEGLLGQGGIGHGTYTASRRRGPKEFER